MKTIFLSIFAIMLGMGSAFSQPVSINPSGYIRAQIPAGQSRRIINIGFPTTGLRNKNIFLYRVCNAIQSARVKITTERPEEADYVVHLDPSTAANAHCVELLLADGGGIHVAAPTGSAAAVWYRFLW